MQYSKPLVLNPRELRAYTRALEAYTRASRSVDRLNARLVHLEDCGSSQVTADTCYRLTGTALVTWNRVQARRNDARRRMYRADEKMGAILARANARVMPCGGTADCTCAACVKTCRASLKASRGGIVHGGGDRHPFHRKTAGSDGHPSWCQCASCVNL